MLTININNKFFQHILNHLNETLDIKAHKNYYSNINTIAYLTSDNQYNIRTKFEYFHCLTPVGINTFCNVQRIINALTNFKQRWLRSKYTVYDIQEDLCGRALSDLSAKHRIQLVHSKYIYNFNIMDLKNVILSALTYHTYMIPEPQMPRNPYNNKPFEIHHLYSIYIHFLVNKIKLNSLLTGFYECNFDLKIFKSSHSCNLIHNAINQYYSEDSLCADEKIEEILNMIDFYINPFMKIEIHKDFPKQILYSAFRPFLKLYELYNYYHNDEMEQRLKNGLYAFVLYNPYYGLKYIKPNGMPDFDSRALSYSECCEGPFIHITESVFNMMRRCKTNYGNPYCISLKPIENVTYIQPNLSNTHTFIQSVYLITNTVSNDSNNSSDSDWETESDSENEEQ